MAQFTNQAQLSYNNATINSNIAVGEILEILSADKIAVTTTYNAGGDVTYVISAVNSGTTPVSGISVTDNLGAYPFGEETLYPLTYKDGSVRLYINGVLQAAPTTVAGPPLVISGITLPANSNMVLVYEATVNSFAPLGEGDSVVNTATVTGTALPPLLPQPRPLPPLPRQCLILPKASAPFP